MSLNQAIIQIIRCNKSTHNECDTTIYEPIGTGFIINSKGYFVTARHNIFRNHEENLNNTVLKDYRIVLNKSRYTFREVDSLSYGKDEIDIIIFKINNQYEETPYIKLKQIEDNNIMGNVTIKGFTHSRDYLKERELYINSYNNNRYELSHDGIETDSIEVGCSGSPIFKENNGEVTIIGVMSFINNGKYYISSINLILHLFYTSVDKALEYEFINKSFFIYDNKRLSMSSSCKEISKETQERLSNLDTFSSVFRILHRKVEHRLIRIEKNLDREYRRFIKSSYNTNKEKEKIEYENELRYAIQYLLKGFREVFSLFSGDISINFKLVDGISSNNDTVYLKTYTRVKAEREDRLDTPRASSEIFEVTKEFNINELSKLSNNYKGNTTKVNYGYNQAICGASRYYICNNLKKAMKEKEYYSSSNYFTDYYNSIAIFVVSEKEDDHEINIMPRVKGLLIIDNIDEGSFEKNIIKEVGGYLSHKLDRLLSRKYYQTIIDN